MGKSYRFIDPETALIMTDRPEWTTTEATERACLMSKGWRRAYAAEARKGRASAELGDDNRDVLFRWGRKWARMERA